MKRNLEQEEKTRLLRIQFRKDNFEVFAEESDEFDKWPFDKALSLHLTFDGVKKYVMHMSFEEAEKIGNTIAEHLENRK